MLEDLRPELAAPVRPPGTAARFPAAADPPLNWFSWLGRFVARFLDLFGAKALPSLPTRFPRLELFLTSFRLTLVFLLPMFTSPLMVTSLLLR